jgi:hypothetical protein
MATSADIKKEIEDLSKELNTQLNVVQASIDNVRNLNGDGIANFLQKSIANTEKLNSKLDSNGKLLSKNVRSTKDIEKANGDISKQLSKIGTLEDKRIQQLKTELSLGDQADADKVKQLKAELESLRLEDERLRLLQDQLDKENEIARVTEKRLEFLEKTKKTLTNFTGIAFTLSSIVNMLFEADKATTKLANNLGISRKEAQTLRSEYSQFVRNADDLGLTTERLIEAQTNLSQELGIAVAFSKEELQTFNTLTKVMGVSNGAAAKLNLIAKASGTEYKNIQSNILKGAIATKNQLGVAISNRDVFEEIGKLSAGILVKFQNNPTALGAAVVEAKKLGLSLEQVDKIGESLLNFESSIENELKAELLTNRELNVERARAAALTGDQATLMKEVAAQAGTLEDFTKLNVIAQGALAGAFGLQREEMAEMLMKQELINQYGDEAAKLNKEQAEEFKKSGLSLDDYLKKQGAQVELQEQFNNAVNQVKELFVSLTQGPFGTLVGMVNTLLTDFKLIYPLVGAIAGLMIGQMAVGAFEFGKSILKAIPSLMAMVGLSEANAIASITAAEAISFGLATVGIIAGITAAVSAMSSAKSTLADDAISPGYGKRILLSPEGSIAFNDKDYIMAGTEPFTQEDDVISGPAGSIRNVIPPPPPPPNNDGLMAGIRELINVTKQGRVSTIDGQVFSREGNRVLNMYTSPYYS